MNLVAEDVEVLNKLAHAQAVRKAIDHDGIDYRHTMWSFKGHRRKGADRDSVAEAYRFLVGACARCGTELHPDSVY